MAPLPLSENASAVALVTFVRAFAQAWGVAVSGTILQNGLRAKLPKELLSLFPGDAELAYNVIPKIAGLSPELRAQTQQAFAESLHLVWVVMIALCGAGMVSVALLKEFPLRKTTDKNWGLKEKQAQEAKRADEEAATGIASIPSTSESLPAPLGTDTIDRNSVSDLKDPEKETNT